MTLERFVDRAGLRLGIDRQRPASQACGCDFLGRRAKASRSSIHAPLEVRSA
jgi:hypothetical protein